MQDIGSAAFLQLALMGSSLVLLLGRKPGAFPSETNLTYVPDLYLHVSNASILILLYAGVGDFWQMLGVSMRQYVDYRLAGHGANTGCRSHGVNHGMRVE